MIITKKIDLTALKGEVDIEVMKYKERMLAIKELNLSNDEAGDIKLSNNSIDTAIKLEEVVKNKIKKVKLKHSGKTYEDLSDLEYYAEYQEVINILSPVVFNGASLGNSKADSNSK